MTPPYLVLLFIFGLTFVLVVVRIILIVMSMDTTPKYSPPIVDDGNILATRRTSTSKRIPRKSSSKKIPAVEQKSGGDDESVTRVSDYRDPQEGFEVEMFDIQDDYKNKDKILQESTLNIRYILRSGYLDDREFDFKFSFNKPKVSTLGELCAFFNKIDQKLRSNVNAGIQFHYQFGGQKFLEGTWLRINNQDFKFADFKPNLLDGAWLVELSITPPDETVNPFVVVYGEASKEFKRLENPSFTQIADHVKNNFPPTYQVFFETSDGEFAEFTTTAFKKLKGPIKVVKGFDKKETYDNLAEELKKHTPKAIKDSPQLQVKQAQLRYYNNMLQHNKYYRSPSMLAGSQSKSKS